MVAPQWCWSPFEGGYSCPRTTPQVESSTGGGDAQEGAGFRETDMADTGTGSLQASRMHRQLDLPHGAATGAATSHGSGYARWQVKLPMQSAYLRATFTGVSPVQLPEAGALLRATAAGARLHLWCPFEGR